MSAASGLSVETAKPLSGKIFARHASCILPPQNAHPVVHPRRFGPRHVSTPPLYAASCLIATSLTCFYAFLLSLRLRQVLGGGAPLAQAQVAQSLWAPNASSVAIEHQTNFYGQLRGTIRLPEKVDTESEVALGVIRVSRSK